MTLSAVPPMPAGDRAPGPSLGASLVVVGIGVAVVIVAMVAIVVPLVGTFTSPAYAVPPGDGAAPEARALHDLPVLGQPFGVRNGDRRPERTRDLPGSGLGGRT